MNFITGLITTASIIPLSIGSVAPAAEASPYIGLGEGGSGLVIRRPQPSNNFNHGTYNIRPTYGGGFSIRGNNGFRGDVRPTYNGGYRIRY